MTEHENADTVPQQKVRFDSGDMTWSPASSADFNEVIVHRPAREAWETLIIEVPKPDDLPNDQWFRFKAAAWGAISYQIEQFRLWAPTISALDEARDRLEKFREEAFKDPKIAKRTCRLCKLDRLNDVHRFAQAKGYHTFEPMEVPE